MRCYHFGNFYMSSIQQGIQAAHAQMELVLKYKDDNDTKQKIELFDWAAFHKTMICLNGGMNVDLQEIKSLFERSDNKFAWAHFKEAEEAMGGMLTNIAIVLPEQIYETASKLRSREYYIEDNEIYDLELAEFVMKISDFEIELITVINSCGMAK